MMENVTCKAAGAAPSAPLSGLTNNVHTYCGLEIAIMQIRPRPNWPQRVALEVVGTARLALDELMTIGPPGRAVALFVWRRDKQATGQDGGAGCSCRTALARRQSDRKDGRPASARAAQRARGT